MIEQGAIFKQNEFTTNTIRMLTADSVNILSSVQDYELMKPKVAWKDKTAQNQLHAGNSGDRHHTTLQ